jgi:phosphate transport system substrate-binding protein
MFTKLIAAACATMTIAAAGASQAADITGAGATFPAPIYGKWAETYKAKTGIGLNYQAIGSGGGIKQIKAKTVDFGATDKPLSLADQNAAGLFMFPAVMGGVVPVMNIPGVPAGKIRLTGSLIAQIYLGDVKRWNDPQIAAFNRGVALPNLPITVVHRSDGSGTSFVFTNYLAMKSGAWKTKVGANDAVQWPTGLGGKGNDGVAAVVKQTVGSIGYVEYAYAKQNHLTYAAMQTHDGSFVEPTAPNFASAAAHADWAHAPGYYMLLLDQPGATSWPITAATFILVYKQQANAETGANVLKFFDWAYKNGDSQAAALDYIALPPALKAMVRKSWAAEVKGPNGQPVYVSH